MGLAATAGYPRFALAHDAAYARFKGNVHHICLGECRRRLATLESE